MSKSCETSLNSVALFQAVPNWFINGKPNWFVVNGTSFVKTRIYVLYFAGSKFGKPLFTPPTSAGWGEAQWFKVSSEGIFLFEHLMEAWGVTVSQLSNVVKGSHVGNIRFPDPSSGEQSFEHIVSAPLSSNLKKSGYSDVDDKCWRANLLVTT